MLFTFKCSLYGLSYRFLMVCGFCSEGFPFHFVLRIGCAYCGTPLLFHITGLHNVDVGIKSLSFETVTSE